jgi:hypothetical protein
MKAKRTLSGRKFLPALTITGILFLVSSGLCFPQAKQKISPYVTLQYFKDNDGHKTVRTTLTFSRNRMELPLPGMKVAFFSGEARTRIADIVTDVKGVSNLPLDGVQGISEGKDGVWHFSALFDGNDTIDGGNADIAIIDLDLGMELTMVDSSRKVIITAVKNVNGEKIPAKGETVSVLVPRMFSLLSVGEVILDDSGSGSLDFPPDLPGDREGNITIIAKIEEHPDFGNVEKRQTIKWGRIQDYSVPAGHRALWTKTAPKWMTYTLTILLFGVWVHYLYAMICLIRIKRSARKEKKAPPAPVIEEE